MRSGLATHVQYQVHASIVTQFSQKSFAPLVLLTLLEKDKVNIRKAKKSRNALFKKEKP